jgi:PAS domain S-box-containing protein
MINQYTYSGLTDLYDFFLNAPIGLHILDRNYVIRMANEADLRITGYNADPSAYVGRRITEIHADTEAVSDIMNRWASGQPLVNFRARLLCRDGSEQPVVIHSNSRFQDGDFLNTRCFAYPDLKTTPRDEGVPPQRVGTLLNSIDESECRELFDVLEDFFENAPVALHIVGPDGLIRRANRMELESLGYLDEPEKYIGHHISEFHADQAVIDEMLERLVGGRPLLHYQAKLVHRNGETMPVVIYSSPRFDDGQFVNTRCFTFPKTVDQTALPPSYSWPRNDSDGAVAEADPLTVALRRLAGRKSAEESLGFLAETSKALAKSDYLSGLSAVCQLTTPFLADWCSIEIGVGDAARSLCTARGDIIAGSDDLVRATAIREERNPRALRAPFAITDGTAGALLMVRDDGRNIFGPADKALTEEIARRVATAIEIGRLRESVMRQ